MKRQLICLTFAIGFLCSSANAHLITVVKSLADKRPMQTFGCSEQPVVYIRWDRLTVGPHVLRAEWYLPSGELQEHTRYPFIAPVVDSWVWLRVREAPRGFIVPITWERQVEGMWGVHLYLDGQSLGRRQFTMRCNP